MGRARQEPHRRLVQLEVAGRVDAGRPVDRAGEAPSAIHKLHLTTSSTAKLMQDSDTSLMVFSIWDLIEYLSSAA